MPWLNWSLKLHVRLRTISHLRPPHITHVYVQWIPYSFVWLYLIKCVVHTQSYVDQTQFFFSFFEYFSCFGKCFVSKIFSKIQKFSTLSFGDSLASHASHEAPVTSLHRRFHDSLASETSNHEKYLEISSKILGFCHFWDSFSRLLCEWKSSHQVTQRGSWLIGEWKS